jgi:hypothetical protein
MTTLENANDGIPDDAPEREKRCTPQSQKQNVEQTVKSTENKQPTEGVYRNFVNVLCENVMVTRREPERREPERERNRTYPSVKTRAPGTRGARGGTGHDPRGMRIQQPRCKHSARAANTVANTALTLCHTL